MIYRVTTQSCNNTPLSYLSHYWLGSSCFHTPVGCG